MALDRTQGGQWEPGLFGPIRARLDSRETNVDPLARIISDARCPSDVAARLDALGRWAEFAPPLPDERETAWRFRHCLPLRNRIKRGLAEAGMSPQRRERFRCCGARAAVESHRESGEWRVSAWACHDRWCPVCGPRRAAVISGNVLNLIRGKEIRFITLTLREDGRPLPDRLDRLYGSFRKLRQQKWWGRRIMGGVAFCQVKLGKVGQGWHVHLHLLCVGSYVPGEMLRDGWKRATGDSHVVDIRRPAAGEATARYVARYASNPLDPSVVSRPAALAAGIRHLHGRRLCWAFGCWRGHRLASENRSAEGWAHYCTLSELMARAAQGDRVSADILANLDRKGRASVCTPTNDGPPDDEGPDPETAQQDRGPPG